MNAKIETSLVLVVGGGEELPEDSPDATRGGSQHDV